MKTLTLKLPNDLNTRLNMVSKKKGISKNHFCANKTYFDFRGYHDTGSQA